MRILSAVLAAMVATAGVAQDAFTVDPYVVELRETVEGKPLDHYANDWWQWAKSMPDPVSAVVDRTGAECGRAQTGPVWYLAGGYGSSKIDRDCTVPGGKHLFFPVINMMATHPRRSCPQLRAMAARNNDSWTYVRVKLNGSRVDDAERFRIASRDCFDPYSRIPKAKNELRQEAATDGYWIMLKPLPPGEYKLEFKAFYTLPFEFLGTTVQNISYDLVVLPEE